MEESNLFASGANREMDGGGLIFKGYFYQKQYG